MTKLQPTEGFFSKITMSWKVHVPVHIIEEKNLRRNGFCICTFYFLQYVQTVNTRFSIFWPKGTQLCLILPHDHYYEFSALLSKKIRFFISSVKKGKYKNNFSLLFFFSIICTGTCTFHKHRNLWKKSLRRWQFCQFSYFETPMIKFLRFWKFSRCFLIFCFLSS